MLNVSGLCSGYGNVQIIWDASFVVNDGGIAMQGTPAEIFRRAKEIKKMGLELPLAAYIAEKLRQRGVPVPEGIMTEEELAEALCVLLPKI